MKKDFIDELKCLQDQCDTKKWLESERGEKDLSGKMDFCEGCDAQIGDACALDGKPKSYMCAKNAMRLENESKN